MDLRTFLKNNIVILDGGTGSLLQAKGLTPGTRPEVWNLTNGAAIEEVHRAYFEAGSDMVCTNTFGVNGLHYTPEEEERLVKAAFSHAKKARAACTRPGDKFIALDIGPLGRLLKPFGDLDFEEAVEYFARLVRLGTAEGADAIWIETMSDAYESKAALLAAKENSELPVMVSHAFGENGRLLTGTPPEAAAALAEAMGADVLGVNCSFGPDRLLEVAERCLAQTSLPLAFKPNAGLPRIENGKTVYDLTPEVFAGKAAEAVKRGARLIGGCCGTTPEHIRLLKQAVAGLRPQKKETVIRSTVTSYAGAVSFGVRPVLIGERLNPTGKKKIQAALREKNWNLLLEEGISQENAGAALLDVNVGLPDIDEPAALCRLTEELQAVCGLPLQLDSASPEALERALRRYNGRPVLNSVSGREDSMEKLFPLMKKYGAMAVALTLDEAGIPATSEGRIAIAEKILRRAEAFGIGREAFLFDPLTMTVGADPKAAEVTLAALSGIKALGCHTVLGVSNVSFGLPDRPRINAAFLTAALERGLSAAILNPLSDEMLTAYALFLHRKDGRVEERLYRKALTEAETLLAELAGGNYPAPPQTAPAPAAFSADRQTGPAGSAAGHGAAQTADADAAPTAALLCGQILQGLSGRAEETSAKLLLSEEPLQLLEKAVLPALDEAGREYEAGRRYLPGLLMCAEAAAAVFGRLREKMLAEPLRAAGRKERKLLLATVKGDIHDIGKNIVRLLLESYGFTVIDLGKDVAPEKVLEAAETEDVRLVGLSALMTTTVPAMEETVRLLKEKRPGTQVIVGGAVLTAELAARIGADAYGKDAMETVHFAEKVLGRE